MSSIPINSVERTNLIQELSLQLYYKHDYNASAIRKALVQYNIDIPEKQLQKRRSFVRALEKQSDEVLLNLRHSENIHSSIISNPNYIKAMAHDPRFQKIFISHSHLDEKYAHLLVNLLLDIGVHSDHIYCSSYAGHGTAFGKDYMQDIKEKLKDNVLVLFLFSDNFFKSNFCQREMGATWVLSQDQIPIYLPSFLPEQADATLSSLQGFPINNDVRLSQFKEEIESRHQIQARTNSTRWMQLSKRFLEGIQRIQD